MKNKIANRPHLYLERGVNILKRRQFISSVMYGYHIRSKMMDTNELDDRRLLKALFGEYHRKFRA